MVVTGEAVEAVAGEMLLLLSNGCPGIAATGVIAVISIGETG